jgi:hypothetical protein
VIVVTDNVRRTAVSGSIARDDAGVCCRGAAICVAAAYAVVDGDPDKADGDEAGARRDDRTRPCHGLIDRICDGPTQGDSPTRSAEGNNATPLEGRLPEPAIIVPWLLPCIWAAGFIFYASIYQCATLRKDARSDLLIYQEPTWLSPEPWLLNRIAGFLILHLLANRAVDLEILSVKPAYWGRELIDGCRHRAGDAVLNHTKEQILIPGTGYGPSSSIKFHDNGFLSSMLILHPHLPVRLSTGLTIEII